MRSMRVLSLAFLFWLGCDSVSESGDASFDAGLDASEPPPHDAGMVDAPVDAGPDATSPDLGAVTVAAMDLEAEVVSFESALANTPPTTLASVPTLELSLCAFGIDAIIGEDGLETLALSDPTVRALADLEQTTRLHVLLGNGIMDLPAGSDPDVDALIDAAQQMDDALLAYHDELANLLRTRFADPLLPTRGPMMHTETLLAMATNQFIQLGVVAQRDATSPEVVIDVSCPPAVPTTTTVNVFDEETGAFIAGGSTSVAPVPPVLPSSTRFLRIGIDPIDRGAAVSGITCIVSITSQRDLRAAPVTYASVDIDDRSSFSRGNLIESLNAIRDARGMAGASSAVLDTVERVVTMMDDVLAPIWGMTQLAMPVALEDLQRALRSFTYADAILTTLLASPELSAAVYLDVHNDVGLMQGYMRLMVESIRAEM